MTTASSWSRLSHDAAMAAAPPRPRGAKRSAAWTGLLLLLGGLATVGGCFLPFEKISGRVGSYSVTGLRSETTTGLITPDMVDAGYGGWVLLVCAVVLVLLGLRIMSGHGQLLGAIVGVVISGAALALAYVVLHSPDRHADELGPTTTDVLGPGIQLATAGCALAFVAAVLALLVRRRRRV